VRTSTQRRDRATAHPPFLNAGQRTQGRRRPVTGREKSIARPRDQRYLPAIGKYAFKSCMVYVEEVLFVMLEDPLTTPRVVKAHRVSERDSRANGAVSVPPPNAYHHAVGLTLRLTGVRHAS
jgi:hypothetical protein